MNSEGYDGESQPNKIHLVVFHFHLSKTKNLFLELTISPLASSITLGVVMEDSANHDKNIQLRHSNRALFTFINILR